ncbi:dynein heavy chain, putative [Plasmodium gaboni]|uniref:Dynein heavy chain, putative n=1 Tax=Plasmodium gaboni TaxID=647221 RepID=A0ABY1UNZ0_9APIC|nr:dynein heavy chain, putative [Plasmodium gaboni]
MSKKNDVNEENGEYNPKVEEVLISALEFFNIHGLAKEEVINNIKKDENTIRLLNDFYEKNEECLFIFNEKDCLKIYNSILDLYKKRKNEKFLIVYKTPQSNILYLEMNNDAENVIRSFLEIFFSNFMNKNEDINSSSLLKEMKKKFNNFLLNLRIIYGETEEKLTLPYAPSEIKEENVNTIEEYLIHFIKCYHIILRNLMNYKKKEYINCYEFLKCLKNKSEDINYLYNEIDKDSFQEIINIILEKKKNSSYKNIIENIKKEISEHKMEIVDLYTHLKPVVHFLQKLEFNKDDDIEKKYIYITPIIHSLSISIDKSNYLIKNCKFVFNFLSKVLINTCNQNLNTPEIINSIYNCVDILKIKLYDTLNFLLNFLYIFKMYKNKNEKLQSLHEHNTYVIQRKNQIQVASEKGNEIDINKSSEKERERENKNIDIRSSHQNRNKDEETLNQEDNIKNELEEEYSYFPSISLYMYKLKILIEYLKIYQTYMKLEKIEIPGEKGKNLTEEIHNISNDFNIINENFLDINHEILNEHEHIFINKYNIFESKVKELNKRLICVFVYSFDNDLKKNIKLLNSFLILRDIHVIEVELIRHASLLCQDLKKEFILVDNLFIKNKTIIENNKKMFLENKFQQGKCDLDEIENVITNNIKDVNTTNNNIKDVNTTNNNIKDVNTTTNNNIIDETISDVKASNETNNININNQMKNKLQIDKMEREIEEGFEDNLKRLNINKNSPLFCEVINLFTSLLKRIEQQYFPLKKIIKVLKFENEKTEEIKMLYKNINEKISKYINDVSKEWFKETIDVVNNFLNEYIFKKRNDLFYVNFHPYIFMFINNIKNFFLNNLSVNEDCLHIYNKANTFKKFINILNNITKKYNSVLTKTLDVEKELFEEKMNNIKNRLLRGVNELKWSDDNIYEYIESVDKDMSDIYNNISTLHNNIVSILNVTSNWVKKSIIEKRKRNEDIYTYLNNYKNNMSILKGKLNDDFKNINMNIKQSYDVLKIKKNNIMWKNYLKFLNNIIIDKLIQLTNFLFNNLYDVMKNTKRDEQLFIIRINFIENKLNLDLKLTSKKTFCIETIFYKWIDDFMNLCSGIRRIDIKSGDYLNEILLSLSIHYNKNKIENFFQSTIKKSYEYLHSLTKYEHIWKIDIKKEFLSFKKKNEIQLYPTYFEYNNNFQDSLKLININIPYLFPNVLAYKKLILTLKQDLNKFYHLKTYEPINFILFYSENFVEKLINFTKKNISLYSEYLQNFVKDVVYSINSFYENVINNLKQISIVDFFSKKGDSKKEILEKGEIYTGLQKGERNVRLKKGSIDNTDNNNNNNNNNNKMIDGGDNNETIDEDDNNETIDEGNNNKIIDEGDNNKMIDEDDNKMIDDDDDNNNNNNNVDNIYYESKRYKNSNANNTEYKKKEKTNASNINKKKDIFYNLMRNLRSVKLSRKIIPLIFQKIKEIMENLKELDIIIKYNDILDNIEKNKEKVEIQYNDIKEKILKYKNNEIKNIKIEIKDFKEELTKLKKHIFKNIPSTPKDIYNFPYEKINDFRKSFQTYKDKQKYHNELEILFEIDITIFDELDEIDIKLTDLKHLWDLVNSVIFFIEEEKKKLWKDIDVNSNIYLIDFISLYIRKNFFDLKHLSIYEYIIKELKKLSSILPLLVDLNNECIFDRHWNIIINISGNINNLYTKKKENNNNNQNNFINNTDLLNTPLSNNKTSIMSIHTFNREEQIDNVNNTYDNEKDTNNNIFVNKNIQIKYKELTLQGFFDLKLYKHVDAVHDVIEQAKKEQKIENKIKEINLIWKEMNFEFFKKNNYIQITNMDMILEIVDVHTSEILFFINQKKFILFIQETILNTQENLKKIDEVINIWRKFLNKFERLQPIYLNSEDIHSQLPEESKMFFNIENEYKEIIHSAAEQKNVLQVCLNEDLFYLLSKFFKNIELCEKALNDYLDQKKKAFPRFYFLSNIALLDILSNGKNPFKILPYINDVFNAIKTIQFKEDQTNINASGNTYDNTYDNTNDNTYDTTNDNTYDTINDTTHDTTYDTTNDASYYRQEQDETYHDQNKKCKDIKTPEPKDYIAKGVYSIENEHLEFLNELVLKGNVENYLKDLETHLKVTIRSILENAKICSENLDEHNRDETMITNYISQVVCTCNQIIVTEEINKCFDELENGNESAFVDYKKVLIERINKLIKLVEKTDDYNIRTKLLSLIILDVHTRDVIISFIKKKISDSTSFDWQAQLKYYWVYDKKINNYTCEIKLCDFKTKYLYEYIGNSGKLVITPLTDKCYITLTQALNLILGGAPAGPAGTGKTETTKDLSKAIGIAIFIFNCSNQMNYFNMSQICIGLSQTGAWGCFDEFNRISIEVLSVVSTQIKCIFDAIKEKKTMFHFIDDEIVLKKTCGFFITMNPGYAGRTELPENLKNLFRSCSMIVPDIKFICENMLMSFGFIKANKLSYKFVELYQLCKELLQKNIHYDWGLRAVKVVLIQAGNLKRKYANFDEEVILMKALKDFNIPKITYEDIPIFLGLINDLFPNVNCNIFDEKDQEKENDNEEENKPEQQTYNIQDDDKKYKKKKNIHHNMDKYKSSITQGFTNSNDNKNDLLINKDNYETNKNIVTHYENEKKNEKKNDISEEMFQIDKNKKDIEIYDEEGDNEKGDIKELRQKHIMSNQNDNANYINNKEYDKDSNKIDNLKEKKFMNEKKEMFIPNFDDAIKICLKESNLQIDDNFILKVKQLKDLMDVRHCVFILGEDGCGKSSVIDILIKSLNKINEKCLYEIINPKSIESYELYGYLTKNNEWIDGALSSIMRKMSRNISPYNENIKHKITLLDGNIDAEWIESMNTVMDDNKVLTLVSNERIPFTKEMHLFFEITNMKYASPATVSRGGVLFINKGDISYKLFISSWINLLNNNIAKTEFYYLFNIFYSQNIDMLRKQCKFAFDLSNLDIVKSVCNYIDYFLYKYEKYINEVIKKIENKQNEEITFMKNENNREELSNSNMKRKDKTTKEKNTQPINEIRNRDIKHEKGYQKINKKTNSFKDNIITNDNESKLKHQKNKKYVDDMNINTKNLINNEEKNIINKINYNYEILKDYYNCFFMNSYMWVINNLIIDDKIMNSKNIFSNNIKSNLKVKMGNDYCCNYIYNIYENNWKHLSEYLDEDILFLQKLKWNTSEMENEENQENEEKGYENEVAQEGEDDDNMDDINDNMDDINDNMDDINDNMDDINNNMDDINNNMDDINDNMDEKKKKKLIKNKKKKKKTINNYIENMLPNNYDDIYINTIELIRIEKMIKYCLERNQAILVYGNNGTGKTKCIKNNINMNIEKFTHTIISINYYTNSFVLQKIIENNVEKRNTRTYGPPNQKKHIFFLEDLNITAKDNCDTQQTLEFLRQLLTYKLIYDRDNLDEKKFIHDISFIGTINNNTNKLIDKRIQNKFSIINIDDISMKTFENIYKIILKQHLLKFDDSIKSLLNNIISFSYDLYTNITENISFNLSNLAPHYLFNLNDIHTIFYNIIKYTNPDIYNNQFKFLMIIFHEMQHAYINKLISDDHINIFTQIFNKLIQQYFPFFKEDFEKHIDVFDSTNDPPKIDHGQDVTSNKSLIFDENDYVDNDTYNINMDNDLKNDTNDNNNNNNNNNNIDGGDDGINVGTIEKTHLGMSNNLNNSNDKENIMKMKKSNNINTDSYNNNNVKGKEKNLIYDLNKNIFTSFISIRNGLDKMYLNVKKFYVLKEVLTEKLNEYNTTHVELPLVLFDYAIIQICKICRILDFNISHLMLIGFGGSGKQSLIKLSIFINSLNLLNISTNNSYDINNFKSDLQEFHLKCAIKPGNVHVLLLKENDILDSFLPYINDLTSTGLCNDLFTKDEYLGIFSSIRNQIKYLNIGESNEDVFNYYINKIKTNLKIAITHSPISNLYRDRLIKFPSFLSNFSFIYFLPWPYEALVNVSNRFLSDIKIKQDLKKKICEHMAYVHTSTNEMNKKYLEQKNRFNYVIPKTFLEYIYFYKNLLNVKNLEIEKSVERLNKGLLALTSTRENVQLLQKEIEIKITNIEEKKIEVNEILNKVKEATEVTNKEQQIVNEEKKKTEIFTKEAIEIQLKADKELSEALPIMNKAKDAVNCITKSAIQELKSLQNPPKECLDVTHAVLIALKEIKNYSWKFAQKIMNNPTQFLSKLQKFDAENMDEETVNLLTPFIQKKFFNYEMMKTKSSACAYLALWLVNIVKYNEVYKKVKPLMDKLQEATNNKNKAQEKLDQLENKVKELTDSVEKLRRKMNEVNEEKNNVIRIYNESKDKLNRAENLVNMLSDEYSRWSDEIAIINSNKKFIYGDCLLLSSFITYLGVFSSSFRIKLWKHLWLEHIKNSNILINNITSPIDIMVQDIQIATWKNEKLPEDIISIENALIVSTCYRWPLLIDPQLQGLKWLKAKGGNNITVLQFNCEHFIKKIKNVISKGGYLIIENISEEIDNVIDGLLNREFIKKGNDIYVKIDNEEMLFNYPNAINRIDKIKSFFESNINNNSATTINTTINNNGISQTNNTNNDNNNINIDNQNNYGNEPGDSNKNYHKQNSQNMNKAFSSENLLKVNFFNLILQTKLSNPHFKPEVNSQCTLINFSVTCEGLEEQILAIIVNIEKPELEKQKQILVKNRNEYKIILNNLEDEILYQLSTVDSKTIIDNISLINSLKTTKDTSINIQKQVADSINTENEINKTRELYRTLANEASIVYFILILMHNINYMYQYSLDSFINLLLKSIEAVNNDTIKMLSNKNLDNEISNNNNMYDDDNNNNNIGEDRHLQKHDDKYYDSKIYLNDNDENNNNNNDSNNNNNINNVYDEHMNKLIISFRKTIYSWINRGLLEKDKLLFNCIFVFKLLEKKKIYDKDFNMDYLNFFLKPPRGKGVTENPLKEWLSDECWENILILSKFKEFENLSNNIHIDAQHKFKQWCSEIQPEICKLPLEWKKLNNYSFKKLLIIRSLRPDRITVTLEKYIKSILPNSEEIMEKKNSFVDTLESSYNFMVNSTPILFILTPGSDFIKYVEMLGKKYKFYLNQNLHVVSLGQGQESIALSKLELSHKEGHWIVLENIHLMAKFNLILENVIDKYATEGSHPNFRCFLTSEITTNIPISILERSIKLTNEAPTGFKENLKRAFTFFSPDDYEEKDLRTKNILFSLCYFHSIIVERAKFGSQGFNIKYPFSLSDLRDSAKVLFNYLDNQNSIKVPWNDLKYIFGEIMYGGHIVNDKDMLICKTYLNYFMKEQSLEGMQLIPFSKNIQLFSPNNYSYEKILKYIDTQIICESSILYGLNQHAEMNFRTNESIKLLKNILKLKLKETSTFVEELTTGETMENKTSNILSEILSEIDNIFFNVEELMKSIPDDQITPLQYFLFQECTLMNSLTSVMKNSLKELNLAIKGEINMTSKIESLMNALYKDKLPELWKNNSYSSNRNLSSWVNNLKERIAFLTEWFNDPLLTPKVFNISLLFNPNSFFSAIKQILSRNEKCELDKIIMQIEVTNKSLNNIHSYPKEGAYIYGLYLDGANYDVEKNTLCDSSSKQKYFLMPVIHCKPIVSMGKIDTDVYECPVYKTLSRGPTYVTNIKLKTKESSEKWILAGVALILDIADD